MRVEARRVRGVPRSHVRTPNRTGLLRRGGYRRFACRLAARGWRVTSASGVIEGVGIPWRTDEWLTAATGAVAPGAAATAATPTGVAWLPKLVFNVNSNA